MTDRAAKQRSAVAQGRGDANLVGSPTESHPSNGRLRSDAVELAGVDPEPLLDAAFRRAVVATAMTDAGGYYLEVNDAFCSLLGYSPEELLTMSFRDITAPGDLSVGRKAMRDLAEGEQRSFGSRSVGRGGGELLPRVERRVVHVCSIENRTGDRRRIVGRVEEVAALGGDGRWFDSPKDRSVSPSIRPR